MKKFCKFLATCALAVGVTFTAVFAGCSVTLGSDGKDGQDVSIYDVYDATNAARKEQGLTELTFLEFVEEYLTYDDSELAQIASLQTTINRSLLSGVSILTTFSVTTQVGYWGQTQTKDSTYAGSGVIIDIDKEKGDMYVVTNCHVVYLSSAAGDHFCDNISLYLYGSELYVNDSTMLSKNAISAEIVAASKTYDIALLKVTGSDLVKKSDAIAADWSMDENIYVGETVYAVGNPSGTGMSATQGIISKDSEYIAIDLEDTDSTEDDFYYRVLRTDASINNGNSGGGLFNSDGKIVGIVNAKKISTSIENVGYALPASTTRRVIGNMLANYTGTETHGLNQAYLGVTVTIKDSSSYMNKTTNLVEIVEEIAVGSVSEDGKAAGYLQAGDVFKAIKVTDSNGKIKEDMTVNRRYNLGDALLSVCAGDTVTVTVIRNGEEKSFSFTYSASDLTAVA
ncbi:MAG: S1C family serine protease [Candidatus Coproplasma sp.]